MSRDALLAKKGAGVKPCLCPHRRNVGGGILVGRLRKSAGAGECRDFLGVPLVHSPEAAEFALDAVEISVVVGVAGDEPVATDVVVDLHPFDDMDRERYAGDPRRAGELVGHIKFSGRRIFDACLGAEIVAGLDEEMGLLPAHQIDVAHWPTRIAGQRRRPDQASRAVAEQVDGGGGRDALHCRDMVEGMLGAPSIAGLVEVQTDPVASKINKVGCSSAVDVGKTNPGWVEEVGSVEPWRPIHRHLRTEKTVPEIGPVTDLAGPDAHEITEAVSRHIRKKDGLALVREDQFGPFLLIEGRRYAPPWPEAVDCQRLMPPERTILGQEQVREPVPRQINEAQVGIPPVQNRSSGNGRYGFHDAPSAVRS